jgi:hypothetical protein
MAGRTEQFTMARQGDILFQRVDALPKGKRKAIRGGVLAFGSATGHSHQLRASKTAKVVSVDGALYVEAAGKAAHVDHEEHDTISLPKGVWLVKRQAEYDPTTMQRTVAD